MPLKSLRATNFGPFVGDELVLEPDVTVITGANDTGKSSMLRLLNLICTKTDRIAVTESDINSDRATDLSAKWTEDSKVTASVVLETPSFNSDRTEIQYFLAPDLFQNTKARMFNKAGQLINESGLRGRQAGLPMGILIDMGTAPQIREKIPLASATIEEKNLMAIAFGPELKPEVLMGLSELRYNRTIADAESRLNARLDQFLPPTLRFYFRLKSHTEKRDTIFMAIEDNYGGFTELGRRGKGIQALINLLGRLAVENYQSQETLLLLDEPETHLHADAQHSLRGALEKLAETSKFQIVYATHSACMVNTMQPRSLRLFTRATRGERAVTAINNEPFDKGFASVRSSLGISPADSLLFAPITIVVEGKTEVLSIPILLKRLSDEFKTEFADVPSLISQTILIDAEGSGNIGYICKLAKGHGASVIAFADGDRSKRWQQQLEKEAPGTPLILSKVNGEFEQIVARPKYFEALAATYESEGIPIGLAEFEKWESEANLPARMAFTKRVGRWFTDKLNQQEEPDKAAVMRNTVENTPLEEIDLDGPRKLIAAMREAIAKAKARL